jgi:hypothetical protein
LKEISSYIPFDNREPAGNVDYFIKEFRLTPGAAAAPSAEHSVCRSGPLPHRRVRNHPKNIPFKLELEQAGSPAHNYPPATALLLRD